MSIDRTDAEKLSRLLRHPGLLGELAVRNGFISPETLALALEEQKKTADPPKLGAILVSRNSLTTDQLVDLLAQQQAIAEQDRAVGPSAPAPIVGERTLGHYGLVQKLGEGGGGTVWKAWDTKLCRWVALKEPRGHRPVARERFIREARTAAKLNHPNLVEVHEVTFDAEQDFIVMEYIDGRSLDEARLSARDAAALMADIADAVDYMHASGVIHRDLKPHNVIVDAKGVGHLGDFGIAKVFGNAPLTQEGTPIGTPQYMAPEQIDGNSETVGPRTDVYGLGATLHFCLVGQPPFPAADSFEALLGAIRSKDPASPRTLDPGIPPELDVIVRRAMARNPGERYSSAAAFRDDLRRFLRGEGILARPDGLARKAERWVRQNSRVVAAVLLAALASTAGAGLYTLRRQTRQEAYEAVVEKADRLWEKATGLILAGQPSPDLLVGALEEAQGLYQEAASANDQKTYPWLMKGRCLMLLGRRTDAEAAWSEALRRNPSYGPALFERGKSNLSRVVRLGLLQVSSKAGRNPEPGPPDPVTTEFRLWENRGEQDLAAAREARDLEKASVGCLEGMLELGRGNPSAAAEALSRYIAEYPWDADALTYLGAAEYQLGKFEEARARWLRALGIHPTAARHKLLGDASYCLRKFPEAVDHYSRALALEPLSFSTKCNRGLARHASGDSAGALEDYDRALVQMPNFARAHNARGILMLERGDLDRALDDFERAAELNEFYAEAHNNLGHTHVRRHDIDLGLREFEIALELRPNYAEARFNRGVAYLLKGDLTLAIEDLEKASALDPKDPDSLYHLALAERSRGDSARSLRDLGRAIDVGGEGWAKRSQAQDMLREWTGK
jgi:tetratricopeptide (TPR) repeat protein/predicted Ser/Thr protein kinase